MTGTLTVRYRSPTPLHTPLVMRAWIREVERRKIFVDGTLHVGDRLCAEAEGIFISIDASVFQRLHGASARRASAPRVPAPPTADALVDRQPVRCWRSDPQESVAVALDLDRADARDRLQLVERARVGVGRPR